jgi:hypothetical protein
LTAWIFALAAVGFVVVIAVLVYHLVITLRQTRQTARALEQFLVVTRPRVEDTVLQVNQILGHANRIVVQAEQADSGRTAAGVVRGVSHVVAYAKAGMQAIQLLKALKSDVQEAWSRSQSHRTHEGPTEVRYAIGGQS